MASLAALVIFALAGLTNTATASAAVRYAAPGGTGSDPCANPAEPCSLYVAGSFWAPSTTLTSGDVIEVGPGTYSEAAGDLGPDNYVQVPPGVTIRGEADKPRPTIELETNASIVGAFFLVGGTVSRLVIENEADSGAAISIDGGTVERIVARAANSNAATCDVLAGTVRDTVCLNEAGAVAIGTNLSSSPGTRTITLRNVTAIASGEGSVGADFNFMGAGVVAQISGKAVLARGQAKDVVARAGTEASTVITLDHSDYARTETKASGGGAASVTAAGTYKNITAAPLLATDGYHQLAASPTVDKGIFDYGSSGTFDIDDQPRLIGSAPDIGADELPHSTSTTVACIPASLVVGGAATSTCTATVSDASPSAGSAPAGGVSFGASGPGALSASACTITPVSPTKSTCQVAYTATAVGSGSHTITASYAASETHEGSRGSTSVTVSAKEGAAAPQTSIGAKPSKRTRKRLAKFTFRSRPAGSSFECKLDRKPFRRCSSPFKRRVKHGRHMFKVRAVNGAGIRDSNPATYSWRVL